MKLDWSNINWQALLQSRVMWSSIVSILAGAVAVTGHTIDAGTQQTLVDNITKIADGIVVISGLVTMHARATAQPTNQTVIVPAKPPATGELK